MNNNNSQIVKIKKEIERLTNTNQQLINSIPYYEKHLNHKQTLFGSIVLESKPSEKLTEKIL